MRSTVFSEEGEGAPENTTTDITKIERGTARGRGVTTGRGVGRGGGDGASGGPLVSVYQNCVLLLSWYDALETSLSVICPFWLEDPAKMSTAGFYLNILIRPNCESTGNT
jgi:hypothetical protein